MAAVCAAATIWIGAGADATGDAFQFTGRKADYYSLLVSGFAKGHLYMDVAVDPRLSSQDPAVVALTPTLQDANYYKGHFYLYYGVVPAALLLLPYRLMTGQDLGTNVACLIFWLFGFGASLFWLNKWWRDNVSRGGPFLAALAVALLAFFPATTFLIRRAMFYELPLIAGFACISASFAALYECIQGRRPLAALAISSAALGLAVGCHPNHIFLFPLLFWVALTAARRDATPGTYRRAAVASLLPATVIGAGLAYYNYARFGSIFEFGFGFGQNEFFSANESLFVPRFLWANFKWYFLTPPALAPYFPFVYPENNTFRPSGYAGAEAMHGALPATLLFIWILVGVAATDCGRMLWKSVWRHSVVLACSVLAALLFIGTLQIRANRYLADFETPLAWLLTCWGCLVWNGLSPGATHRLWKLGFTILIFGGFLFNVLASVQQFELFQYTRPVAYSKLSRALNIPYRWLYASGMDPPGLLSMKVHFNPQSDLTIEPLVTTGTPGYSDSVYVATYPNRLIQFRFNHKGHGGPTSPLEAVDFNREHLVEVSMGSFYPPFDDSYFGESAGDSAHFLKRLAYVRLDGRVIMSTRMNFYEASPWSRQVGKNATTLTEFRRAFSGRIIESHVIPTESFLDLLNVDARSGVLAYKVHFPDQQPLSGLPLLGCGVRGDGNLIFAKAEGGSSYRLEMDDWSYGALKGESFLATQGEHTLQVVVGPLLVQSNRPEARAGVGDVSALADRIVVWLDGRILGGFKVDHHLKQIGKLTPAANPQGFSTAVQRFDGAFEAFPMTYAEVHELLTAAIREAKL
jgi:hypothetical protein